MINSFLQTLRERWPRLAPILLILALLALVLLVISLPKGEDAQVPSSTPSVSPSPTQTLLPTHTATPTSLPTATPSPTITPTPAYGIQPPAEDEVLVIVTSFSGEEGLDSSTRIYRNLFERADDSLDYVRVVHLPSITPTVSKQAIEIGEKCGATLVIWGEADDYGVEPRLEVIHNQRLIKSRPVLGRITGEELVAPDPGGFIDAERALRMYIYKGMPNEYEYLMLFSLGQMAYFSYDYEQAIALFDQALQLDINWDLRGADLSLPVIYHYRGNAYRRLGHYPAALADYNLAVRFDPDYIPAYTNLGYVRGLLGEQQASAENYQLAIEKSTAIVEDETTNDGEKAWALYKRSEIYCILLDFEASLADIDRAIDLESENAEYYFYRGEVFMRLYDTEAALADYEWAVDLDPEYAAAYVGIGNAQGAMGNYESAFEAFKEAEKLAPRNTAIYRNRGVIYERLGNWTEALADYTRAIELNPTDAWIYSVRGNVYRERGDLHAALADYEQAISIDPSWVSPYIYRANVHAELGDIEKALADFDTALEIAQQAGYAAWCYNNRGFFYENRAEYDAAIADYTSAIEQDPTYSWAYVNRGDVHGKLKNFDAALTDINRGIEIRPQSGWAYNIRAILYERMGDFEAAAADFGRAIEVDPDYGWPYVNRGNWYARNGRMDEAKADFDALVERNPLDIWALTKRAEFYKNHMKDPEAAIADYTLAIELAPKDPDLYLARAKVYGDSLNDSTMALADYSRAIDVSPEEPFLYAHRAEYYRRALNDLKAAVSDYTQLIELDPLYRFPYSSFSPHDNEYALVVRAKAYHRLGDTEAAVADLDYFVALDSPNARAYAERAWFYYRNLDDLNMVIADLTRAVEINPVYRFKFAKYDYEYVIVVRSRLLQRLEGEEPSRAHYEELGEFEPDSASAYASRAEIYYRELNDIEAAIANLTRAVEIDPLYEFSFAEYGYQYAIVVRSRLLEESRGEEPFRAHYRELVEFKPKTALDYTKRAYIYYSELNDIEAAIADLTGVIDIDPLYEIDPLDRFSFADYRYEHVVVIRAELYQELGRTEEALADFDTLVELQPDSASAYARRAEFYYRELNDTEAAIADLTEAIEMNPLHEFRFAEYGYEYVIVVRSRLLEELTGEEPSSARYEELAEFEPDEAWAYAERAQFYYNELDDPEAAIADLTEAIEIDPLYEFYFAESGRQYVVAVRAKLYLELGRTEEAIADYGTLAELQSSAWAYVKRAEIQYRELDDVEAAIADLTEAVKINPVYKTSFAEYGDEYVIVSRCRLLEELGSEEPSSAHYEELAEFEPDSAWSHASRAEIYYRELNDIEAAIADLTEAIEIDLLYEFNFPEHGYEYAIVVRAKLLEKLEGEEASITLYKELREFEPDSAEAYAKRAEIYYRGLSDVEAAIADLTEAIEIDLLYEFSFAEYGYRYVISIRAELHLELGHIEEALADFDKLVDLRPSALAYASRAELYCNELNNVEAAIADLTEAIEITPLYEFSFAEYGHEYAIVVRSRLLEKSRGEEPSRAHYEELGEFEPDSASAYAKRAEIYCRELDDLEAAITDLTEVIEIDPLYAFNFAEYGREYVIVVRARLLEELGSEEPSSTHYEELGECEPDSAEAYAKRAEIYYSGLNDLEAAITDLTKAIEIDLWYQFNFAEYDYEYMIIVRSRLLEKLTGEEPSNAHYKELREFEPDSAEAYTKRAKFYYHELDDVDAAIADLTEAIKIDPLYESNFTGYRQEYIIVIRAELYLELGQIEDALDDYGRLAELQPDNAWAYTIRAEIYYSELNDTESAIADLTEAIEIDPVYEFDFAEYGYGYVIVVRSRLLEKSRGEEPSNAHYKELDGFEPDGVSAYAKRAEIYYRELNDTGAAIADLTEAIDINPLYEFRFAGYGYGHVLAIRGWLHYELGHIEKALADYDTLVELQPESAAAFTKRAEIYYSELDDVGTAIADLTEAIEINPLYEFRFAEYGYEYVIVVRSRLLQRLEGEEPSSAHYEELGKFEPDSVEAYAKRAEIYYSELNDKEAAIADLTGAIEIDPLYRFDFAEYNSQYVIVIRAELHCELGQTEKALADLDTLFDLMPESAWPYVVRAEFYYRRLHDLDAAIADYTIAIKLDSGNSEFYLARASFSFQQGQLAAANSDFDYVIDAVTRGEMSSAVPARSYRNRSEIDVGIAFYTRVIDRGLWGVDAYVHRASLYYDVNELEMAIDDYTSALKLDRENAQLYIYRGITYYTLEQYQTAIEDYTKAIDVAPQSAVAYVHRGNTQRVLGNLEAAVDDYSKAIEIKPEYDWPYLKRGEVYHLQNKLDAALVDLSQALDLGLVVIRVRIEAYQARGAVHRDLGNLDEAVADFSQAIALDPDLVWARAERADIYSHQGKWDAAILDYVYLVELEPQRVEFHIKCAAAHLEVDDPESAIDSYTHAIELDPQDASVYYSRSLVYFGQRDYGAAIADYWRFLVLTYRWRLVLPVIAVAMVIGGLVYLKKRRSKRP